MQMPALTQFVDGSGPIFGGNLFPFVFITIACGAISGFHALIASGTTPKLLEQRDADPHDRLRRHGDGIVRRNHGDDRRHACSIPASSSPSTLRRAWSAATAGPSAKISSWGFPVTAEQMTPLAQQWAKPRSSRAPAARRRWRSAWPASSASVFGGKR